MQMLEIETEPLTEQPAARRRENHADNNKNPPPTPSRFHLSPKWQKFLVVLAVACIFMIFYDTETAEEDVEGGVYTSQKSPNANTQNSVVTAKVLGGGKLIQLVAEQKQKFEAQLQQDYGPENFQKIFQYQTEEGEWISRGRQAFGTPDRKSWFRMKRKLIIKILTAQIQQHLNSNRQRQRHLLLRETERRTTTNTTTSPRQLATTNDDYFAQFIWANGGHSSSAGHGNFHSEAYTAVMERAMKPYFAPLGIEFIGKNYAMGGTSSGEEIALCTESVFGRDIDALTWDFGMTDAGRSEQWKQLLYSYHTAFGKQRPAAVGIEMGGSDNTRTKIYDELDELGMITFYRDFKLYAAMQQAFPDTQGLTDALINDMPPLVQYFKCGEGIEKGDPGCGNAKYNLTDCADRKGQASWHPGWKIHALQGNIMALFLGEVLFDAVKDVATLSESDNLSEVLNRFIADEEEDYANVTTSSIPPKLSPVANWMLGPSDEDKMFGDINVHEFFLRRSFCHIALLPADIRYRGLLTQSDKVGLTSYDEGVPQPKASDIPAEVDTGDMRLAYDVEEHASTCPYNIGIDYKDFFFLSSVEGWKTLTFPNDAEKQYYNIEPSEMLGVILICLATCDWNKCKDGDLRNEFDQGALKMEVNGVEVKSYDTISSCWALKGEQNGYHWSPNNQGKYDIRAKLEAEQFSYLRFGSFILV